INAIAPITMALVRLEIRPISFNVSFSDLPSGRWKLCLFIQVHLVPRAQNRNVFSNEVLYYSRSNSRRRELRYQDFATLRSCDASHTQSSLGQNDIEEHAFVVVPHVRQVVGEVGEVVADANLHVLADV